MQMEVDSKGPRRGRSNLLIYAGLLIGGAGAAAFAAFGGPDASQLSALAFASALAAIAVGIALAWPRIVAPALLSRKLRDLLDGDPVPQFLTDRTGTVLYVSASARLHLGRGTRPGDLLARCGPDGDVLSDRLIGRSVVAGAASEDRVIDRGRVRVSARLIGGRRILWRVEDIAAPSERGRGGALPMLAASAQGTILYMNDALRRLVDGRPRTLAQLFDTPPSRDGTTMVATPGGAVRKRLHAIDLAGGRRELYLLDPEGGTRPDDAFESMPVALLRLGQGGRVLAANRLARDIFGAISEGGHGLSGLVEGLGRDVSDWVDDALAGRAHALSEVLRVRDAGADTYLQVTLGPPDSADGRSLVAVLHDATELKTLEAQFVQSQKMQAIGQLAGGVAHDFNNLLTAISGHCDLLLLRHDKGDEDHADLVQINANANRAAGLVKQLLAFSRKQTLEPETLDLRETLADMMHLLNRLVGEKVVLTLVHDPELRAMRADRRQLEQVLMNLVVNARDALPDGGQVRVETENVVIETPMRRDRVEVPAGRYVGLRVVDQGTGISADELRKVFEPFYTTKRQGEGTGLGLSTAYGIVKQTGGFIFCDSAVGEGTTFTLLFPAHERGVPSAPPQPTRDAKPCKAPRGTGTVLLVEDEAPVRAFASRALNLRGYTVIEAESGEAALEVLSDGALDVDLFVTDVIMPGLDGPSWVRRALKDRPDKNVVFMSGYAEDALDDAGEFPNSVFLPKPFSLSELATTVQAQIG